jgi:hypothetical protein
MKYSDYRGKVFPSFFPSYLIKDHSESKSSRLEGQTLLLEGTLKDQQQKKCGDESAYRFPYSFKIFA